MINAIIKGIGILNFTVGIIFFVCYFYQFVYVLIPFIKKPKPHKAAVIHEIAILISARNESAVIGHLLDSISAQDYPKEHLKVFVIADNCTDNTADIAREHGAIVYERSDTTLVGKGYALNYLMAQIDRDYGVSSLDAFIVLDADNLLETNYVSAMNQTFSDGYNVTTSYRNSKNYGDNWISAGYALWFMREARFLNNSRYLLNTSCAVSGTGFLFSRELIERLGGWHYFLLTEDIEFTTNCILENECIGYCDEAVLYDEQPVTFKQSWKQRLRWSKGFLQVWSKYGLKLLRGIFKPSFACFDMTMTICPAYLISVLSIVFDIIGLIIGFSAVLISGPEYYKLTMTLVHAICTTVLQAYLLFFVMALLTLITEWKNIHCTSGKKIKYLFSFPIYLLSYMPIALAALVKRVEWSPIEHTKSFTVSDIKRKVDDAENKQD